MTNVQLAEIIANTYVNSYNGGSQGRSNTTFSIISSEKFTSSIEIFNKYAEELIRITKDNKPLMKSIMESTQSYTNPTNRDFIHFVLKTKEKITDNEYILAADAVLTNLQSAILTNAKTGSSMINSNGMALWMPTDRSSYESSHKLYKELAFTQETKWRDFLEALLYPTGPELSIATHTITDDNNDGFINAGETLNLAVKVSNTSPIAAKNVNVQVTGSEYFTATATNVEMINQGLTDINVALASTAEVPVGTYKLQIILQSENASQIIKEIVVNIEPQYKVEDYVISSTHPYADNYTQSWIIEKPEATMMRIHFARFETELKYDYVSLYDKDNNLIIKLDGAYTNYWTPVIKGNYVKIEMVTDRSINKYGFDIDKVAY